MCCPLNKFAGYAKSKLVPVRLDFPRHKEQDAVLKQANEELSQRFGVAMVFPPLCC